MAGESVCQERKLFDFSRYKPNQEETELYSDTLDVHLC